MTCAALDRVALPALVLTGERNGYPHLLEDSAETDGPGLAGVRGSSPHPGQLGCAGPARTPVGEDEVPLTQDDSPRELLGIDDPVMDTGWTSSSA